MQEQQCNPAAFVGYVIARLKTGDTAFRAAMSRADNPDMESYAWEYIIPYCNIENESERLAFAMTGAAIARSQPEADGKFSFGIALRSICENKDDEEREIARLRRVIATDTVQELITVLRPVLNYIASKGGVIGYVQLLNDIIFWDKKIQRKWIKDFIAGQIGNNEKDSE